MKHKNSLKKVILVCLLSFALISCNNTDSIDKNDNSNKETVVNTDNNKDDENKDIKKDRILTDEDISLLSKVYDDMSLSERQRFDEIIDIFPNLSKEEKNLIIDDFERLKKEKESYESEKTSSKEEIKPFTLDEKNGTIYEYGPGTYGIGNNVDIPEAGHFNMLVSGNGNLKIIDKDGNTYFEDTFDNNDSYHIAHVFLFDGWTMEIGDNLNVKMQLDNNKYGKDDFIISRGKWSIGQNISPGKYKIYYNAKDLSGESGKIDILNDNNSPIGGIIINRSDKQSDDNYLNCELNEGQTITVTGISKLVIKPIEE